MKLTGRHAMLACLSAVILTLSAAPFAYGEGPEAATAVEGSNLSEGLIKVIGGAIQKVKPSLVRIFVVAASYDGGREVKYETVGSGVIITADGCVVTNHHVAGNAKQMVCTLSDKDEVPADLIGTDPLSDIAVIKLRGDGKRKFPAAEFGDSSLLRVGDRVLAMGSPFALSQSVTMGIVSNTEVVLPEFLPSGNRLMMEGEDVGSVVRWIGHDAQIFGGNSGGPLVNLRGEIVGINEISIGISGAIPGNQARAVAEELIRSGKVRRSWFGLDVQPRLKNEKGEKGALISGVVEGSPADKAGFMPGDILASIAGKEADVHFPEEIPTLNQMMMDIPVGETVEAVVRRDGKELRLRVTSQEREYVMPKKVELSQWGMTARNLSLMDSKEMKREGRAGVLVTSVRPGGPCRDAEPKVAPGDVIVEINNAAVKDVEDLMRMTAEVTKGKADPVPVLAAFERDAERYLTVVKLSDKTDAEDQGIDARKPWLPVSTQVITKDIAAILGDPGLRGMRITRVYKRCSAVKTGLVAGDVITALNGEAVAPSGPEESDLLEELVRQYSIGSKAEIKVLRGGQTLTVEVVLEQSPRSAKDMKKYTDKDFEFTVRDVSSLDDVKESGDAECGGVLVESVSEGGWASLARLSIGDLILAVDGSPVADAASFEEKMKRTEAGRPKSIVFKVLRTIHTMFIEMEPAWPAVN